MRPPRPPASNAPPPKGQARAVCRRHRALQPPRRPHARRPRLGGPGGCRPGLQQRRFAKTSGPACRRQPGPGTRGRGALPHSAQSVWPGGARGARRAEQASAASSERLQFGFLTARGSPALAWVGSPPLASGLHPPLAATRAGPLKPPGLQTNTKTAQELLYAMERMEDGKTLADYHVPPVSHGAMCHGGWSVDCWSHMPPSILRGARGSLLACRGGWGAEREGEAGLPVVTLQLLWRGGRTPHNPPHQQSRRLRPAPPRKRARARRPSPPFSGLQGDAGRRARAAGQRAAPPRLGLLELITGGPGGMVGGFDLRLDLGRGCVPASMRMRQRPAGAHGLPQARAARGG
jgi:hypothetical protein